MTTIHKCSNVDDLRRHVGRLFDLNDDQAARVAQHLWENDPHFPHPVNNTDIGQYLAELDDNTVYDLATGVDA